ncbi:helix-turn-helix transcriptional regulator [Nocardia beijingensis]|uniref:helix-turn-helix domain-containing protein n=1 Tax=Nocardia beijingensis TaxID=95162 RepID=UPI0033195693
MSDNRSGVAARVAQARKLGGLTQRQLAAKANVSVGLVQSVEQGRVPATPAFLGSVSKALRVSVAELNGQPFPPAPADVEVHSAIAVLRTELAAYDIDNAAVLQPRGWRKSPPMSNRCAGIDVTLRSTGSATCCLHCSAKFAPSLTAPAAPIGIAPW